MMWGSKIPETPENKASPRIENGVLYWTEGDTFTYCMDFKIVDQDCQPITLDGERDTITVSFLNRKNELVKTFLFGKEADTDILNNSVSLSFDEACSKLFVKSTPDAEPYYYSVLLDGDEKTTLVKYAPCVVE